MHHQLKIVLLFILCLSYSTVNSNPYTFTSQSKEKFNLKIELLKLGGVHFEYSTTSSRSKDRIYTTPMVLKKNISLLPSKYIKFDKNELTGKEIQVKVNPSNLCFKVYQVNPRERLVKICPKNINEYWKKLTLETDAKNAYGLGQNFQNPGTADGDLVGRTWDPGYDNHGNQLRWFNGGANGLTMIPVLYGLGSGDMNFLFFYDNIYKQLWNLKQKPWSVESYGDLVSGFIYTAENVKKLRRKYMALVGKPLMPPKDIFGLWLSEFGFDNWREIDQNISILRKNRFPLDGVSLDIQWFGGRFFEGNVDRSASQFGSLRFDQNAFPNPKQKIANYKKDGVELMTIEESYVSQWLPEFDLLQSREFLAYNCSGTKTKATILTANPWWGIGGMIDWTNPQAGQYWHQSKRQKLINMGITHHWTDLGEPEMYSADSCYYGFPEIQKNQHGDIHNIFNFKWLEGIADGYKRNKSTIRPFSMTRSGTAGVQRFGTAFWSGDIGANMGALTAHYNAQVHMSFSGIDYYGADVGGFHRRPGTLDGDENELFTQWFANASLFDFPIRAHTWNLSNNLKTNPAQIGDIKSNLFNIRLRYQLMPYYYSLAYQAYKFGDSIIRPMVMEFQVDQKVREMGNQKMIGPYLMAAMVARYGERERKVYLPKGNWYNFYTGTFTHSEGENVSKVSAFSGNIFRLPLFIKQGAIIPMTPIEDVMEMKNISGLKKNGSNVKNINFLIYPFSRNNKEKFSFYEDDGKSNAYQKDQFQLSQISHQTNSNKEIHVTFNFTGSYNGKPSRREITLTLISEVPLKTASIKSRNLKIIRESLNRYKIKLGSLANSGLTKVLISY
ncbi:DUF5110 domain-containing protein [Bacteriovoracaceae bacterium]|nr:DUF5110 domain-containing protein [Bacteriovoracaceae bacterium]